MFKASSALSGDAYEKSGRQQKAFPKEHHMLSNPLRKMLFIKKKKKKRLCRENSGEVQDVRQIGKARLKTAGEARNPTWLPVPHINNQDRFQSPDCCGQFLTKQSPMRIGHCLWHTDCQHLRKGSSFQWLGEPLWLLGKFVSLCSSPFGFPVDISHEWWRLKAYLPLGSSF